MSSAALYDAQAELHCPAKQARRCDNKYMIWSWLYCNLHPEL